MSLYVLIMVKRELSLCVTELFPGVVVKIH